MKKIFYIATALCTMGLASCDIDDVENVSEMSQSQFPATDADAEAVLGGVYQNLNTTHANPQMSFQYYACLASDDQLGGGGTNDKLMQAEDLLCNYNADMTNQFYIDRYSGIARANTLLGVLGEVSEDTPDSKKKAMGEAKFLRAFYYYELASMYGNVPLVRNADEADNKQGDVKVLWGQILQDLRDACDLMPSGENSLSSSRTGHVDKYAAEAMLGRAWLFYTGFYCNGTTTADLVSTNYSPLTSVELPDGTTLTKQDVITYIDDCVNNSGYSLVGDFRNLWAYTNKKTMNDYPYAEGAQWVENDNGINPESMFAIKFNKKASWSTTIGYSNGIALHFSIRGGQDLAKTFPFGQGWGAGPVAPNLVKDWKAYSPNDKRLKATVCDVNEELPEYTRGGWADYVQETDYYAKKWSAISCKNDGSVVVKKDDGTTEIPEYLACFETCMYGMDGGLLGGYGNNFQLDNIHDLVLIRYADVLLMQAELKEEVTDGWKQICNRAGTEAPASYSLRALQNERRWEFACEGLRWNDIRRWHIAAQALAAQENQPIYYCGNPDTNTAHNGGYVTRYNATAGFAKMPETQITLGTVQQNDGWTGADSEYTGW